MHLKKLNYLIISSTFLTSYSMLTHANIMETWWGLTNMTSIESIDFMLHYSSKTSFAYIIVAKVNDEVNILTCKYTHWGKSLIFVQKSRFWWKVTKSILALKSTDFDPKIRNKVKRFWILPIFWRENSNILNAFWISKQF